MDESFGEGVLRKRALHGRSAFCLSLDHIGYLAHTVEISANRMIEACDLLGSQTMYISRSQITNLPQVISICTFLFFFLFLPKKRDQGKESRKKKKEAVAYDVIRDRQQQIPEQRRRLRRVVGRYQVSPISRRGQRLRGRGHATSRTKSVILLYELQRCRVTTGGPRGINGELKLRNAVAWSWGRR